MISGAALFIGGVTMLAYELTMGHGNGWIVYNAAMSAIGLSIMLIGGDE